MIKFPLFRRYPNGSSYFKIHDSETFEEIQFIGSRCVISTFKATILPDRYLLDDMIKMIADQWVAIDESEYQKVFNRCAKES